MEERDMPQRFRGNGIGWGPDTILDRPSLAPLAANVCANWVLIEEDMAWLFSLLMGVDLPNSESGDPQFHPIGSQIFDAMNNLQQRLDLLLRLLKWRKLDEKTSEFQNLLEGKIRKQAKERNAIAHGLWGVNESEPDALILVGSDGLSFIYKKRDFEQASKRILELHKGLQLFIVSIHGVLKKESKTR